MAVSAVGLQTHIWNNNVKSVMLLLGFPLLLLFLLWLFFLLSGASDTYAQTAPLAHANASILKYGKWVFIAAGIWFTYSWFSHQRLINKSTGARPLERKENPKVYNMLENLCISRGVTMPSLYIIDSPVLNAYASGINQKTYAITLTKGIINALDDAELEAVIGHELTHILNRDVRLLIISVIFVGMISFLAQMLWRSVRFGRGKRNIVFFLLIGLVLGLGYLFAKIIRFAISRKREYLADAGAVELTKKPDAMVSALMKIAGNAKLEGVSDDVHQMCIENPPSIFALFDTHPPIEKRIAALQKYAGAQLPNMPEEEKGPWG